MSGSPTSFGFMLTYTELVPYWMRCHTGVNRDHPSVIQWAHTMEFKLGPNTCRGFIIRNREVCIGGLFLGADAGVWTSDLDAAILISWGEAAVRITNNPKLEAIRIDHQGKAIDYKGILVGIMKEKPLYVPEYVNNL